MPNTIGIKYRFELDNGTVEDFDLKLDADSLVLLTRPGIDLPDWTRLSFKKCSHCTLDARQHSHCPAAVALVDVVRRFDSILSYDEIDLEVTTEERKISQRTTAQTGVSSLIGLLMATSGCPYTEVFKPMARFHLPMANRDETMYRASSMYLLSRYLLKINGEPAELELDGLKAIYDNLHTLNTMIVERLRKFIHTDASVNAIIQLDMYSQAIPHIIDDSLEGVRHLFDPYLK